MKRKQLKYLLVQLMVFILIEEAVVLAGGIGSRLFPLTKHRPKPLVPIANYTMLDWNFHVLKTNGIKKVIVVVRYLGEQIKNHIADYTSKIHPDLEILVPDVDSQDTADAIRKVSHLLIGENFIVTMADIITNINLKDLSEFHIKKEGIATISLKAIYNQPRQFGVILLDENSKILHFLEKPRPQELYLTTLVFQKRESVSYHTNLINTGIYAFNKDILNILNDFKALQDFGKDVFPFLLKQKLGIFGYTSKIEYFWADCGRSADLRWTTLDVLNKLNWPYLPKGNEKNGSWFGEDTIINEHTSLESSCVDYKTIIEKNVHIKHSSIGHNCYIESGSKIEKSIIWNNVKIGKNVKINNAIIADYCDVGDDSIIKDDSIIAKGQIIKSNSIIEKGTVIE